MDHLSHSLSLLSRKGDDTHKEELISSSPSATRRVSRTTRIRDIRFPIILAIGASLVVVAYTLSSIPISLPSHWTSSSSLSPEAPLLPFRERLRVAQQQVSAYPHQRHIWQSAKSRPHEPAAGESEQMWGGWKSWEDMNPGWERHFIDDDRMEHHVLKLAALGVPEVLVTYRALPKIVLKSDFLRYVIMFMHGGVWTDIDTRCQIPISAWAQHCAGSSSLEDVGLIVGTEVDGEVVLERDLLFSQFIFAARAGHPVLLDIIARVVEHPIIDPTFYNILMWTGPRQWTDTITNHLNSTIESFDINSARNLEGPAFFGDLCVAPIYAFGSGRGSVSRDDPRIWAEHFFHGTWT